MPQIVGTVLVIILIIFILLILASCLGFAAIILFLVAMS